MKLKTLGLIGLAIAGVLVAIALAKQLIIVGIIGCLIYYFVIRRFRRSRQEQDGGQQ
jgi:hypothetical protein